jgi:phage host-nuclease inhibitor protein Gam
MGKVTALRKVAPAKPAVPQTTADAAATMAQLGSAMAEHKRLQAEMDAEVAKVAAKYQERIRPVQEEEDRLFDGLRTWAEANREDLCSDGTKTVNLGTGEVGWRVNPEKVSLAKEAQVIEVLRAKGLEEFIRVKESVDKALVLKRQDEVKGVKGLTIVQDETFRAKPSGIDMEKLAS